MKPQITLGRINSKSLYIISWRSILILSHYIDIPSFFQVIPAKLRVSVSSLIYGMCLAHVILLDFIQVVIFSTRPAWSHWRLYYNLQEVRKCRDYSVFRSKLSFVLEHFKLRCLVLMSKKKPTRCHLVLYLFLLYKLLNMFRATLCPSSGADDLVVFFHGWCSVVAV